MKIRERLEKLVLRKSEVEALLSDPETLQNSAKVQKLTRELAQLRPLLEKYVEYKKEAADRKALDSDSDADPEIQKMVFEEKRELDEKLARLQIEMEDLLLKGSEPDAARDVIMEIRAGTGGEEAALFVGDLYRMYERYAARHGLKVELMESSATELGGFKEVIFSVSGQDAHSYFCYERGIHRVQRVPKTEASGRVHTSAVTVAVLAEVGEEEIEILPKDLKIDVYRAGGKGGQHVNKTESAVRITHLPSGFVVTCQDERSQMKNKASAMRVLRARLFDFQRAKEHDAQAKERKEQVGTGDRSGKIRTYNFPDQRVTDHRIGLTLHSLNDILDGSLDPLVDALWRHEREQKLTQASL
jgi:peptide chain release factor 1